MASAIETVATVDVVGNQAAIWWVHVGPKRPRMRSRMVGAWVIDTQDTQTIDNLLRARIWWSSQRGASSLPHPAEQHFDVAGTIAAVNAERILLQNTFEHAQNQRSRSARMIAPEWPMFPSAVTPEQLPEPPDVDPPHRALVMARWISMLCSQWEELEEQRLARPMLRKLTGSGARPLPMVTA